MIRGTITDEQITEYVRLVGLKCPFCSHDDLHASAIQRGSLGDASAVIRCLGCKASWHETWKLVGIRKDEIWLNEAKP